MKSFREKVSKGIATTMRTASSSAKKRPTLVRKMIDRVFVTKTLSKRQQIQVEIRKSVGAMVQKRT